MYYYRALLVDKDDDSEISLLFKARNHIDAWKIAEAECAKNWHNYIVWTTCFFDMDRVENGEIVCVG